MRCKRLRHSLCLLLFVSLILLPSVCFASFDATFRQSPSGLLVNLSGINYWRHSDNAVWVEGESGNIPNPNYYYDNQIVCSVELQRNNLIGGSHDLELSLELLSNEWCYILNGNDSKHKRPFGLQIMARGQLDNGSYATIGQGVSIGGTAVATAGNLVIPASVADMYSKVIYDVVLVFDRNVDTQSGTVTNADGTVTYYLLESESYYSATIRLTARTSEGFSSYDVYLNGYYSSASSDTSLISSINVSTLASVANIVAKDAFASGETLKIADYSYSTNTLPKRKGGNVAISLSSAGLESTTPFFLRHVNANGGTSARITSHNAMMFYVNVTTERGHSALDPQSDTVSFDGSSTYPLSGVSDHIVIPAETRMNIVGNNHYTSWFDSGTIEFAIPGNQMINNEFLKYDSLVSGAYTANIFVNIIPDF